MSEWKPIETAPKDGTEVLLGVEVATVWITRGGYYVATDEYNEPLPEEDCGWWSYCSSVSQESLEGLFEPTHWAPMPDSPGEMR